MYVCVCFTWLHLITLLVVILEEEKSFLHCSFSFKEKSKQEKKSREGILLLF
jgi:hypothetical protein